MKSNIQSNCISYFTKGKHIHHFLTKTHLTAFTNYHCAVNKIATFTAHCDKNSTLYCLQFQKTKQLTQFHNTCIYKSIRRA